MWLLLCFSLLGYLPVVLPVGLFVTSSEFSSWVLLFLSSQLLRAYLVTLSSAHLGHLYLVSVLLRSCSFLGSNSGPVQTTTALWVRVLTTLYLAARLWGDYPGVSIGQCA